MNAAVSIANQAACLQSWVNHALHLAQLLAEYPAASPGEALKGTRACGVTRGQGQVEGEARADTCSKWQLLWLDPQECDTAQINW